MLHKKILATLATTIVCSSTVFAGSVGEAVAPSYKGLYIEGNVGYAYHPWIYDRTPTSGLENELGVLTKLSNINGGAIGGADLGYQFASHLAIEGGWFYVPTASYNRDQTVHLTVAATTFTLPEGLQVNIHSGVSYIAMKGLIPIFDRFNGFAKLGAAYVYNHTNVNIPASAVNSAIVHTVNHSNFWNPLLAVGLQYSLTDAFTCNVQYDAVPGYRHASVNHFIAPDLQTITLGSGYRFGT